MFVLSASHVKTVSEWASRSKRRCVRAAAERFARENMVAVVMHGDDSATVYLYDVANDRVAKTVFKEPGWVA